MDIEKTLLVGLFNAVAIIGLYIAGNERDSMQRDFILGGIRKFLDREMGYWSKPFLGCYKCMASMWGGVPMIGYLIGVHGVHSVRDAVYIFFFSLAYTCYVCGLSAVIYKIYSR